VVAPGPRPRPWTGGLKLELRKPRPARVHRDRRRAAADAKPAHELLCFVGAPRMQRRRSLCGSCARLLARRARRAGRGGQPLSRETRPRATATLARGRTRLPRGEFRVLATRKCAIAAARERRTRNRTRRAIHPTSEIGATKPPCEYGPSSGARSAQNAEARRPDDAEQRRVCSSRSSQNRLLRASPFA
jgi:hypothetical protein